MYAGNQELWTRKLRDAQLRSLEYLEGGSIRFWFETGMHERFGICLRGVKAFFGGGFLENNVVESIEVLGADDIVDEHKYFVWTEGKGQDAERFLERLRKDNLRLFILTPSHGAEIGCACEVVEALYPEGD